MEQFNDPLVNPKEEPLFESEYSPYEVVVAYGVTSALGRVAISL